MKWNSADPAKFHRLFYPQVPVIITVEFQGRIGGMPAIWCMPVSFNPPLVGVAIGSDHETSRMVAGAQAFGVNWVDYSYARQVGQLGEISGREHANKISVVGFTALKGNRTSQPLIQEASAALECKVREKHRIGTHELFVGEVNGAYAKDEFNDYWDLTAYNPLFYAGTVDGKEKSWLFTSGRGEKIRVPMKHQP